MITMNAMVTCFPTFSVIGIPTERSALAGGAPLPSSPSGRHRRPGFRSELANVPEVNRRLVTLCCGVLLVGAGAAGFQYQAAPSAYSLTDHNSLAAPMTET